MPDPSSTPAPSGSPTARPRRARVRLAAAIGAAALLLGTALWRLVPAPPRPLGALSAAARPAHVLFSLLAVGDTGDRHWLPSLREGQLAVARGMVAEDLRRPVDRLLLLGDNFYPDGLRRDELVERVRANVVWPFCRFVALDAERSAEVAGSCTLEPDLRRPIPIDVVLGNHDYTEPESPELQRRLVPRFVSNWHLPDERVAVRELEAGVSLVLIDSQTLEDDGAEAELVRALRSARGPWRIAAAHHPMAPLTDGPDDPRAERLRRAIARAGVRVHLFLSGHRHSLQAIGMQDPLPALQLIVGSGSTHKPLEREYAGRRFGVSRNGFARVELVSVDGDPLLVATLYGTARYPAAFWRSARALARWSVDRSGGVRERPRERAAGSGS